jgi:hypothetical protein
MTFGSVFSGTPSTSVYEITAANWSGMTRPEVGTTHMGTTVSPATFGGRTYIPGDFVDPGELSVEGHFNPSLTPPIEQAQGTLVLVFPAGIATATAQTAKWTCTAASCTSFSMNDPMEDKMTFDATFKMSGGIEVTDGTAV